MVEPETLATLRRWVAGRADDHLADDVGFFLHADLEHGGYRCSPLGSVAFASTGGDGVHFSLLDVGAGITDESPVVMTVPMALSEPNPNWIVGENLRDFLTLGIGGGFFTLEQLADDDEYIDELESLVGTAGNAALAALAEHFGLDPRPHVERRLAQLEERFGHLVRIDPLPDPPSG